MRVPAALHRWAAEHNQQLSASTRSELAVIASIIDASSLNGRDILDRGADFDDALYEIFPPERAERTATLVGIVAEWAGRLPAESPRTTVAELHPTPSIEPVIDPTATSEPSSLTSPAFLRSDQIDDEDSARLFGSARSYLRLVAAALSVILLAALGIGVWVWANSRSTATEQAGTDATDQTTEVGENVATAVDPAATATAEPSPTPVTFAPLDQTYWADTTTVLNGGSREILASTYPVSPANRAVLTGHADAITGIAVTDDGRVLTSGADQRLVDWGSDVTLKSPDVLTLNAPLTALLRTSADKLVAGDSNGNLTVLDLRTPTEPETVAAHSESVSALAELADGRIAVASVDGAVALLSLDAPGDALLLPHELEVTALASLADGSIATAAVDGIVRVWPLTGGVPTVTFSSLGAPATALTALSDGRLAMASVQGAIHLIDPAHPAGDTQPVVVLTGHTGAVRALAEFEDERFGPTLASGGDDSSIRLHSLRTEQSWQQLDGHGDVVSTIAVLPNGHLVSTSADGTGRVWDLDLIDSAVVAPPHSWNLSQMAAWRNDQFITGGSDGLVMLASTTESSQPEMVTRHSSPVVGLTVMPNGDVVSLDSASVLRLAQIGPDGADPIEMTIAPGATSLDDRGVLGIVTGHADGTVRFSDFTAETGVIAAHGSGVNDVLGHSSGLVISAGNDKTVRLVDPKNPATVPVFDLHTEPVTALAELPDGRVASAGADAIYVWSIVDMGAEHVRLSGHRSRILALYGLPDGRLVSTGDDGRVRLWDLQQPDAEAETLVDVPGVVNPHFIQADNGLFVAGAGRGYVVFTIE